MKEILFLVLTLPIGLLFVLNSSLSSFQPAPSAQTPPVVINIPITPVPTIIPQNPVINAEVLIANAKSWLGVRYLWGGCTRHGVDCSCLMVNAFATIGVGLPRTTILQIAYSTPVPANQAQAGDLVFFDNTCTNCGSNPTHVGLVISPGMMIDAGDPVKIEPIYGGHNTRYGRVLR